LTERNLLAQLDNLRNAAVKKNNLSFQQAASDVASAMARLLSLAKREHENSEDPEYKNKLSMQIEKLQKGLWAPPNL
jgi:hypothetical protein